jgi:hypothetical protein
MIKLTVVEMTRKEPARATSTDRSTGPPPVARPSVEPGHAG